MAADLYFRYFQTGLRFAADHRDGTQMFFVSSQDSAHFNDSFSRRRCSQLLGNRLLLAGGLHGEHRFAVDDVG